MAQWAKCLSCIHRTRVQSSRPHEKLHVVSAYRAHIPAARWVLETEELPEAPKPCSLADTVTHEKRLLLEHVEPSTWVVIWPPWDKCIYTNTQTHAHTGGAFWVFLFFVLFLKTRMYLWRKDRARHIILFRALNFLMGNTSGESSDVMTTIWMFPDHRPQREKHTISPLLRLLDKISTWLQQDHMIWLICQWRDKKTPQSCFRYDTICMCMRTSRNTADTGSRMLQCQLTQHAYLQLTQN